MPILPEEISVYILPDVNHPLPTYTEGCLRTLYHVFCLLTGAVGSPHAS